MSQAPLPARNAAILVAEALAALGLDDFVTVAPGAPGGIMEKQTNQEEAA